LREVLSEWLSKYLELKVHGVGVVKTLQRSGFEKVKGSMNSYLKYARRNCNSMEFEET
jgi:hypothetical protein